MGKPSSRHKTGKATSELLGGVIFIALSLTAVIIVLSVSGPRINTMKDTIAIEHSKDTLTALDRVIRDISEQSPGTARIVPIQIKDGKIVVDGDNDQIYYTIDTEADIISPGTKRRIGNLWYESNTNASLREEDNRYILENEHLIVNITRFGSSSAPVSIDPDQIIDTIHFIDKSYTINNNITIHIDDEAKTGTGYTWTDNTGSNLGSATVYAFISNTDLNYTIKATLESGSDFIKISVNDMVPNNP